jgi:DNA gyrase subunit A
MTRQQLSLFDKKSKTSPGAVPSPVSPTEAAAVPPVPPRPPKRGGGAGSGDPPSMQIRDASLAEETQNRYLNYALSVVTSRALPDVRDGMKPVQRRILFGMQVGGHRHDEKQVKCARIVGDVMGKYHPHGDTAIYDALVRMAQSFTLRVPLVDGQGNFGSPDGDAPAAMRYTEARLTKAAQELLSELHKDTVDFRENYDGSEQEPTVLPARFPNLLVNGSAGIAVGMATSIPPHNFGEVVDATIALIDEPQATTKQLLKHVRGPDFPTGGQLVATKRELEEVYETGQGSLKLQGTWKVEEPGKGQSNPQLVLTSIPYAIERKTIVEKIAEIIIDKRLPQLLDVRDESTEDTRIVCEIKKGTDPQLVVAYLFKHTPFQSNVSVNLTCLVPVKAGGQTKPTPARLGLRDILRHFLDFRMEVVVRRLSFDLAQIQRRIHILEGFVTIFDALDETIRIIRKSQGKADAAQKLIARFGLSAEQTDSILELRLYRLAQLEINIIRTELEEKKKEEKRLAALLSSEGSRWKLIRAELHELRTAYGDKRATKLGGEEVEYDAEAFIVDEDQFVLLSRQGWIKRQGRVDLSTTRVREGDSILDVVAGSTKACVALFSSQGACYVCRIVDLPQTTGYGEPVQTIFKMADGERIVRLVSFDPRVLEVPPASPEGDGPLIDGKSGEPEPPYAVAVTRAGLIARFSLRPHREPSTRAGRKYARLSADFPSDEVLMVDVCEEGDRIACGTAQGHGLVTTVDEVPILAGAGKGVKLIKLEDKDDAVLGARLVPGALTEGHVEPLVLEHENGKTYEIYGTKRQVVGRGGKGSELFKRGKAVRALERAPVLPVLPGNEDDAKKRASKPPAVN